MVFMEALDFPGAVTQGFDPADARVMLASAIHDVAEPLLAGGRPRSTPNWVAYDEQAELIEPLRVSIEAGTAIR